MTNKRSLGGLLHWATHRIPGVPAHTEVPLGHLGTLNHGRARRPGSAAAHASLNSPVEPLAGPPSPFHTGLAAPDPGVLQPGALMKAAVLHEIGGIPRYEDFPDPVAGDDEVVIDVRAVAVENVDKLIAAGAHYASHQYTAQLPAIPAFDGIGALPDGALVGFGNPRQPYGALAEKTVVPKGAYVPIAEGIDPAIATVLGTAITGMSIKTAAGFVPGETVLVQGATGVAGRLAVKVARLLGAGRIIATGRDDDQLREVRNLGADEVINTAVPDEALAQAYLDAKRDGYDVVLDYLWGRPTEILLRSLVPQTFAFPKPTRLIQIGESAGGGLVLAAESLRTSGVEICGAAKGLSPQTMQEVYGQVVTWAQSGELTFDVVKVPLSDIETAWQRTDLRGSRLVVVP